MADAAAEQAAAAELATDAAASASVASSSQQLPPQPLHTVLRSVVALQADRCGLFASLGAAFAEFLAQRDESLFLRRCAATTAAMASLSASVREAAAATGRRRRPRATSSATCATIGTVPHLTWV
jgi:hypothetical protein